LKVRNLSGEWISAPPIPGTFVCNIGDMLKVWLCKISIPKLCTSSEVNSKSNEIWKNADLLKWFVWLNLAPGYQQLSKISGLCSLLLWGWSVSPFASSFLNGFVPIRDNMALICCMNRQTLRPQWSLWKFVYRGQQELRSSKELFMESI
jgi:hypothetical protein